MRVFRGGIDRGAGLNLHRRQLNESQRALIGAKAKPMFELEAKERQATSTGGAHPQLRADLHKAAPQPRSSEKAAETVNVSARLVDYARGRHNCSMASS